MNKYVEFYGLSPQGDDEYQGHVVLDGKTLTATTPRLKNLIKRPILSPEGDRVLSPKNDTEEFFSSLQYAYRSAYMRASPPSNALSEHADLAKDDDQDEKAGLMADVLLGISPDAHDLLYEKKE